MIHQIHLIHHATMVPVTLWPLGGYGTEGSDPRGFDGFDGFGGSKDQMDLVDTKVMRPLRPPLAAFEPGEAVPPPAEVAVAPDASPLDFLSAVYRDPTQPMSRRVRAGIEALPFVHPKFAVFASIDAGPGFAARLEAALKRSGKVIEHEAAVSNERAD